MDKPARQRRMYRKLWAMTAMRLILPSLLTVCVFLAAIFLVVLPELRANIVDRKREMLRELVQTAMDGLAFLEARRQNGELTMAQARELAVRQLRQQRYGREMKDYFWINDMHPTMVMHPYRSDLEGKDISDFADPNGKRLFVEFVQTAKAHGEGFVDYMWQWKDDPKKIAPKLSFIKEFTPWGWIVGTGVYLDDVDHQIAAIIRHFTQTALGTLGIIAVLLLYVAQYNFRSERSRMRAETSLRQSREMLRLVMDNIPQYIYWRDKDGVFQGCNKGFRQLAGLAEDDAIQGLRQVNAPGVLEDGDGQFGLERAVMESGRAELHVVEPRRGPGGAEMWLESNRVPLRDEAGEVFGVLCTHEDITPRIETGRKLAESERRFRSLVEHSPAGILILKDGRVVYSNPEQKRLFGVERDDFYFDDLMSAPPGDLRMLYHLDDEPGLGEGRTWEHELRFYPLGKVYNSMELRWVLCRATRISHKGGPAYLIIMLDISRAKELEHMVKIQDKMASLGRVAAGIAHEIRNPLSGINLYLSALQGSKAAADPATAAIIEKMRSVSGRIEAVVKRVLDFSRPTTPMLGWMQVNRALENVLDLTAVSLRKAGVSVELRLEKGLPLIYADQQLLEQVFVNLVTNAMQAMKDWNGPRRLLISSAVQGHRVSVRVADSGPGVPPEHQDRIFDPFFSTGGHGSGIGLSLCARIVGDLGGALEYNRGAMGGAEFVVSLPAVIYWGYDSHG